MMTMIQQVTIQSAPPAPPPPPALPGGAPLSATSTAQAIEIVQAQIAGLKKEIVDLTGQLTPGTSRAREQSVEHQIARANDRLDQLQGQLDRLVSGEGTFAFAEAPQPPREESIPPEVMDVIQGSLVTLVVLLLGLPLVRVIARRLEPRPVVQASGEYAARFDRLEQAVDAVAIEMERVSEGQRYNSKVLGDLRALPAANPLLAARPLEREGARVEMKG